MVCVKDTATWPRLTLVSRLPSVCTAASGSTETICSARGPAAQPIGTAYGPAAQPTTYHAELCLNGSCAQALGGGQAELHL